VVGSFMLDLVMRVPRRPGRGETVFAGEFGIFRGGKGFNQAVAARRLGAAVAMVGRLGDDEFAARFRSAMDAEGIDATGVVIDPDEGTGIATPLIEEDGNNSIVVAPRANMHLTTGDIERSAARIAAADVLLLQLEVPTAASEAAARLACAAGRTVIFNPAPAAPFPDALLHLAHVITPNEVEATAISGVAVCDVDSAFAAADVLQARGAASVVITLGALGCIAVMPTLRLHVPAFSVAVVDTTAAGDAFNGALAAALAEGQRPADALAWANAAGACAVTRLGAEPSLPRRDAVAALSVRAP
jgi:ribokinase